LSNREEKISRRDVKGHFSQPSATN
jgi:hypothetical protein